jgi:outer membrane protein assembly factor BamE (lipoprotein component of BamABCDE complex)
MKLPKYITFAVTLLLLAGCSTTFRPWKLSEIEEGMDRNQVVDILGDPDSVEFKDQAEYLYYSYTESVNPPLAGNAVQSADATLELHEDQVKQSFSVYRYVVKLVDGKVQNYKELTD